MNLIEARPVGAISSVDLLIEDFKIFVDIQENRVHDFQRCVLYMRVSLRDHLEMMPADLYERGAVIEDVTNRIPQRGFGAGISLTIRRCFDR